MDRFSIQQPGWALYDEGRYPEALELFRKAQTFRESQGNEENLRIARWCVAKTLRMMGKPEEALAVQRALESSGEPDAFVDEEIGECLFSLGQVEEAKPYFRQAYAALSQIDWVAEDTYAVLRKIRAADGAPGVLDRLFGREVFLYDAHAESELRGRAGEVIAQRHGAICRATRDGAVWIGQ